MPVTVTCPQCGASLKLKNRAMLGRERPCPKCRTTFVLKDANGKRSTKNNRMVIVVAAIGILVVGVLIGKFAFGPADNPVEKPKESNEPVAEKQRSKKKRRRPSQESEATISEKSEKQRVSQPTKTQNESVATTETTKPLRPEPPQRQVEFHADAVTWESTVQPFLQKNCQRCHGPQTQEGGFRVDQHLKNDFVDRNVVARWSEVLNVLNAGDMPPEGEPQPALAKSEQVIEWIEAERLRGERTKLDRGVVLRRMNRVEYNNTIRDLIGVDLRPADVFPEDPPAAGFDNNGGALSISPLQLELYLQAANRVLDRSIVTAKQHPKSIRWRFQVENGGVNSPKYVDIDGRRVAVTRSVNKVVNGMVQIRFNRWERYCHIGDFRPPTAGEYKVRVRAAAVIPTKEPAIAAGRRLFRARHDAYIATLNDPQKKKRANEVFEGNPKLAEAHYQNDADYYDYGPPRMKVIGTFAGRKETIAELDVDALLNQPTEYEFRAWFNPNRTTFL